MTKGGKSSHKSCNSKRKDGVKTFEHVLNRFVFYALGERFNTTNLYAMNTKSTLLNLNVTYFKEFIKLDTRSKQNELKKKGVLLDNDLEKEKSVNLYFINGFFVEETISRNENKLLDIIPYKHGYRIQDFAEITEVITPKRKFGSF